MTDAASEPHFDHLTLKPIGVIRSDFKPPAEPLELQPLAAARRGRSQRLLKAGLLPPTGAPGRVEVFSRYAAGLTDVENYSHLYLLFWFHLSLPP